jgi:FkbM family methyltransferase
MNAVKKVIPGPVYRFLKRQWLRRSERKYFDHNLTSIRCGAFEIEVPKNHLLARLSSQPYRDLCVGISAKFISAKYPTGTMVDIGANVGDTAAFMASYASNKLILVEGSDYFFRILERNVAKLPNEKSLKQVLVSDGSEIEGYLRHWGGTALFIEDRNNGRPAVTEALSSIADENTCFIKTDTDGYDVKILSASMEWLEAVHPGILFENQIRTERDRQSADELLAKLYQIGYRHFVVWDDAGFHLLSTSELDHLLDLNRYMYRVFQNNGPKSIFNYDVLCLHGCDADIFRNVHQWYRELRAPPLVAGL